MARHITTGFPAPFPLVTPAHIAGPKPGLDGTALLRASTRVQSVPLRPGNIGNPETLYVIPLIPANRSHPGRAVFQSGLEGGNK